MTSKRRVAADPALSTLSADSASWEAGAGEPALRSEAPIRDPGRYDVLGEHGRGGLGRVSRVYDKDLGRDIAIKELLSRGHINDLRFMREAMITARLEHPGIVPVYEAGRWPDGTPFYAMKLVSGRPLRALIAERKTVDERIGLLHHAIAVADAIAYAHGRNIIHRDLQPANVIIGDFGETVVIDWGLAKDLSEQAEVEAVGVSRSLTSVDDQLTTVGSVLGTPAYMAPEQERGESVDQRADVFAIGAMLWELCSLQKVPPTNLAQRHRLLRRAGIDHDLIVIIDKAIDPDPRSRYRDAGALAADLKAFKSGARIVARDYSLPAMLAHWTRRHRPLALSALAFAALLIVGIVALGVLYRDSSRNAELARDNARIAQHNSDTARARLIQSYAEQGRHALLDGNHVEALLYLMQAARHGDSSPNLRFMLGRAAEPLSAATLRVRSSSARTFFTGFSHDGTRIVASAEDGAHVWDAQSGRLLFDLPHGSTVLKVLYNPDGTRLVTFGLDGIVKIWSSIDGALVRVLRPPADRGSASYRAGAISPDGKVVAAVDREAAMLHVWDVSSGKLLAMIANPTTQRVELAFSQDGHWLATISGDEAHVFETGTWKLTRTVPAPRLSRLAFDPTGPRLVTGTVSGDVAIWDVATGHRLQHLLEHGEEIRCLAVSPDGTFVAAGGLDGTELVWRVKSGALQARIAEPSGTVYSMDFDHTSRLLASSGKARRVVVLDVETGIPISVLGGPSTTIGDVQFDPSSLRVVGTEVSGTAWVWNIATQYQRWSSPNIGWDCGANVSLDQDSRYLAVSCYDHSTRVWDTASDRLLVELPPVTLVHAGLMDARAAVSGSGDLVAIARKDTVEIYAVSDGTLVRTVRHAAAVTAVRFAERGHGLVTGSADGVLLVSGDGDSIRSLPRSASAIDAAGFLADGRIVATSADRRLTVFDVERGTAVATLALSVRVQGLRISHDGQRLVTIPATSKASPPVLWDLEHARKIASLEDHRMQVFSAHFVGDGHEVLTAGMDGAARRWDGDTGALRQTYFARTGVLDAVVSPDGNQVVGAGGDGNLFFWDAASGAMLWTLPAHTSIINGLHFEGNALITRGFDGEIRRWAVPTPPPNTLARYERLVACGPVRFDDANGNVVSQSPSCDGPQP
ncbi:MAG: protein kinase [Kofleriaceae bacterium]